MIPVGVFSNNRWIAETWAEWNVADICKRQIETDLHSWVLLTVVLYSFCLSDTHTTIIFCKNKGYKKLKKHTYDHLRIESPKVCNIQVLFFLSKCIVILVTTKAVSYSDLFTTWGQATKMSFVLEAHMLQNTYPTAHQFSRLAKTFYVLFFESLFSHCLKN